MIHYCCSRAAGSGGGGEKMVFSCSAHSALDSVQRELISKATVTRIMLTVLAKSFVSRTAHSPVLF